MKKKTVVLEIGTGDYNLCKDALKDVAEAKSSAARTLAALRYGGREVWGMVVTAWEDALRQVPNPIKLHFVRYYSDDTAQAILDD